MAHGRLVDHPEWLYATVPALVTGGAGYLLPPVARGAVAAARGAGRLLGLGPRPPLPTPVLDLDTMEMSRILRA